MSPTSDQPSPFYHPIAGSSPPKAITWPDGDATISTRKPSSLRREVKSMSKSVEEERGGHGRCVLAVVRNQSVGSLQEECRIPRWKFWKLQIPTLQVTSENYLQATLEDMSKDPKIGRDLTILVSGEIDEIFFKAPSRFHRLCILRVDNVNHKGNLLVDGASTFKGVSLSCWQDSKQFKDKKREIFLGQSVFLKVDPNVNHSWVKSLESLPEANRQEFIQSFQSIQKAKMNRGWWSAWKGWVAGIIGTLTGVAGAYMHLNVTAAGFYTTYKFGQLLSINSASVSVKAAATGIAAAGGTAFLLGGVVAASIYFIPWGSFFAWLQTAMSWIWSKVVGAVKMVGNAVQSLWERLKTWIASWSSEEKADEKPGCFGSQML